MGNGHRNQKKLSVNSNLFSFTYNKIHLTQINYHVSFFFLIDETVSCAVFKLYGGQSFFFQKYNCRFQIRPSNSTSEFFFAMRFTCRKEMLQFFPTAIIQLKIVYNACKRYNFLHSCNRII